MSSRAQILEASRELFIERGPGVVTTEDIRRRAGVSTGSLYHHFPNGKASLVGAVFEEALRRHHDGVLTVLAAHSDLADGLRAGCRHFVEWVEGDPGGARLLLSLEDLAGSDLDATIGDIAGRFAERLAEWLTTTSGRDRESFPFELVFSVWIGPAKDYARSWLAGQVANSPTAMAEALSEAAVNGVLTVLSGTRPRPGRTG